LTVKGERGPWGGVFLASGLFAMTASFLAAGYPGAVPFAVACWVVTVYAGYRIWRAAHPTASFGRELSRRTASVIWFCVVAVVALVAGANPVAAVVVGVLVFAVLLALFYRVNRTLK
jgi:hypothetical protein